MLFQCTFRFVCLFQHIGAESDAQTLQALSRVVVIRIQRFMSASNDYNDASLDYNNQNELKSP